MEHDAGGHPRRTSFELGGTLGTTLHPAARRAVVAPDVDDPSVRAGRWLPRERLQVVAIRGDDVSDDVPAAIAV
jgi:hypothetical protein